MSQKIGERRDQSRLSLDGEVTAKVRLSDSVDELEPVMVENVTKTSIQIAGCFKPLPNDLITLVHGSEEIQLRVVWVKRHYRYPELNCCAACVMKDDTNLIEMVLGGEENFSEKTNSSVRRGTHHFDSGPETRSRGPMHGSLKQAQ